MVERPRIGLTGEWDTRISRRTLLRTGGSLAAGLLLLGRTAPALAHAPDADGAFGLGVASGDPTPDGAVLWTRLASDPLAPDDPCVGDHMQTVRYEVASDPDFTTIVRRGETPAPPGEAHTVHAEVAGLDADTWYWYRSSGTGGSARSAAPARRRPRARARTRCGSPSSPARTTPTASIPPSPTWRARTTSSSSSIWATTSTKATGSRRTPSASTSRRSRSGRWPTTAIATPSTAPTRTSRPPTPPSRG